MSYSERTIVKGRKKEGYWECLTGGTTFGNVFYKIDDGMSMEICSFTSLSQSVVVDVYNFKRLYMLPSLTFLGWEGGRRNLRIRCL